MHLIVHAGIPRICGPLHSSTLLGLGADDDVCGIDCSFFQHLHFCLSQWRIADVYYSSLFCLQPWSGANVLVECTCIFPYLIHWLPNIVATNASTYLCSIAFYFLLTSCNFGGESSNASVQLHTLRWIINEQLLDRVTRKLRMRTTSDLLEGKPLHYTRYNRFGICPPLSENISAHDTQIQRNFPTTNTIQWTQYHIKFMLICIATTEI